MIPISGFTIVRNGVKLGFPLVESIRSILAVCDEVVVNVGTSDDGTLDVVRGIGDPRIRIVESEWDMSQRIWVLDTETLRAMRACRNPWGIYIQADEVLHEDGARELAETIRRVDPDPRVEGLTVDYLHFYGDPATIARGRRWYRREVRAVRLDPALGILPYAGAQGFRVGQEHRRTRCVATRARVYHYGWARRPEFVQRKREANRELYPRRSEGEGSLNWTPLLAPYRGEHPAVARDWVAAHMPQPGEVRVGPPFFHRQFIRYYLSHAVERLTGWRPFEFRNYRLVSSPLAAPQDSPRNS